MSSLDTVVDVIVGDRAEGILYGLSDVFGKMVDNFEDEPRLAGGWIEANQTLESDCEVCEL